MRTTAGLKIDLLLAQPDPDQPDPPLSRWRAHRHGLDQCRVGRKFRIGDPLLAHFQIALDQGIHRPLQRFDIVRRFRHVKIQPALFRPNLPATDWQRNYHAEQMQRRVDPHVPVPPLPCQGLHHTCPDHRQRRWQRRNQDHRAIFALYRHRNLQPCAVPGDPASIAWLPTAGRVKDRLVQHHAAFGRVSDHGATGFAQIGLGSKQGFGHRSGSAFARFAAKVDGRPGKASGYRSLAPLPSRCA